MEKRALSWQEFLDSGFDGRDYNFPDFEGTFEAEMVCKRWDKNSKLLVYLDFDDGRKIITSAWQDSNYKGLADIPFNTRVRVTFDQYIAQADFLGRTGITTTDELLSYKADKEALIKTLDNERKGLKNKQRQCARRNDEKGAAEIKAQVDVITSEMSAIRKEIKLCTAIAERSARVHENLEDIRQQESERKEKTTDELLVRRGGRTSRENDPERG